MIAPPTTTVDDAIGACMDRAEASAQITIAASVLAQRPRNRRKRWTGWLNDTTHLWRGRQVVTPDRRLAEVVGAVRGKVLVEVSDPNAIEGFQRRLHSAGELTPFRLPAAVLLGRQKRGVREKPSALKQATARLNGMRPCAPGKRRGRPRRSAAANPPVFSPRSQPVSPRSAPG